MWFLLFLTLIFIFALLGVANPGHAYEGDEEEANKGDPPPQNILSQAEGNTEFALALYRALAPEKGNIFISPFSISSVFAMVYPGAQGETAKSISSTLCFKGEAPELIKAFGDLDEFLLKNAAIENGVTLGLADSLWLQKGESFKESFLEALGEHFKTQVFQADFKGNESEARREVNDWASKETEGKLKDLLSEPLSDLTRFLLVNAVYFKGSWKEAFELKETAEGDFTLFNGEKVKMPFMHRNTGYGFLESEELSLLEMFYKGDKISLVILLPKEGEEAFRKLEESLTPEFLNRYLKSLDLEVVNVSIPKFGLGWGTKSLKEIFLKLGLTNPFGPEADFSGITGDKSLVAGDVFHKAHVELNEEGTEAVAASVFQGMMRSCHPKLFFNATRPFIFLIREKDSGTILFLGRYTDPESA